MGLFSRKSKEQKLQDQYKKLLAESHKWSTSNRALSDQKVQEANEILKVIDEIRAAQNN